MMSCIIIKKWRERKNNYHINPELRTKNQEKFCCLCYWYRNISKYYIDYYIVIIILKFNKILNQGNIIYSINNVTLYLNIIYQI